MNVPGSPLTTTRGVMQTLIRQQNVFLALSQVASYNSSFIHTTRMVWPVCYTRQVQDRIKDAGSLSGWTLESHTRGMEALRGYTSSGDCRHAALINFFQPGALNPQGPCEGGCDNCKRR